jgi:hypothetical protein
MTAQLLEVEVWFEEGLLVVVPLVVVPPLGDGPHE